MSTEPGLVGTAYGILALFRPENVVMAAVGVLVGAWVANGPGAWSTVGLAAAATALVTAGGNAVNDVVDRKIDARAHPDRPIPSGKVSARLAAGVGLVAFALALALAAWVNLSLLVLVAAAVGLLVGYELLWKARGLVGNVVVAALVGATFLAGAVAVDGLGPPVGFLAGLAFLANVAREVWKDVEDAEHDEARDTLAHRLGPQRAGRVAQVCTLAAVVLSPLPLFFGFGGGPFVGLVGLADAVFLAAVLAPGAREAQRLSKGAMVTALAAFAAGGVL